MVYSKALLVCCWVTWLPSSPKHVTSFLLVTADLPQRRAAPALLLSWLSATEKSEKSTLLLPLMRICRLQPEASSPLPPFQSASWSCDANCGREAIRASRMSAQTRIEPPPLSSSGAPAESWPRWRSARRTSAGGPASALPRGGGDALPGAMKILSVGQFTRQEVALRLPWVSAAEQTSLVPPRVQSSATIGRTRVQKIKEKQKSRLLETSSGTEAAAPHVPSLNN